MATIIWLITVTRRRNVFVGRTEGCSVNLKTRMEHTRVTVRKDLYNSGEVGIKVLQGTTQPLMACSRVSPIC